VLTEKERKNEAKASGTELRILSTEGGNEAKAAGTKLKIFIDPAG